MLVVKSRGKKRKGGKESRGGGDGMNEMNGDRKPERSFEKWV